MTSEKATSLPAKDIASILREIRQGATIIEACGGCRCTVRKFEWIRHVGDIAQLYKEACVARGALRGNG